MKYIAFAIFWGAIAMMVGVNANASYDAPETRSSLTLVERMQGKKPTYSNAKYLQAYHDCLDRSGVYNLDAKRNACDKYADKVARLPD